LVCTSRHSNYGIECGYKGAGAVAPSPPAEAPMPNATTGDWPSYNKTLTSERYSQLSQINTKNVSKLKVLCTYDTNQYSSFESGLIMVNDALIGTTEFDIFSLDPGMIVSFLSIEGASPMSWR
jgi:alcohol dehydrogenase (cytochrome c)